MSSNIIFTSYQNDELDLLSSWLPPENETILRACWPVSTEQYQPY